MDRSAVHRIQSSLRPVLSWLDPWSRRSHAQHVSPAGCSSRRRRIDPDPVARNGLRTLLHGLGIDVSTFDSAESYLLAADGRHLGCLIVDLLLPGMSGLELLRRLRSAGDDVR